MLIHYLRDHCRRVSLTIWMAGISLVSIAQESEIVYLSGRGVDDTKTWKFKCTDGQHAGRWGKIEVPSQWELQGYGDYTYGRWYVNKDIKMPSHEEGFYEYSFSAPTAWRDKAVTIWFDGVMTDAEVSINGVKAGDLHQGGFYRFSYDVTDLMQYGKKNKLEVHVWKHSANKSINAAERKADWWLFGGIYRPVWLEVAPKTAISHLAVDAKADGQVSVQVETTGDVAGYALSASVAPLHTDQTVGQMPCAELQPGGVQAIHFRCDNVRPWNCEDPNLYELTVSLHDNSGTVIHSRKTRIGFRTIDFRPQDGLYLNGTKLIVKGVNRHSFWPEGGRTTSKQLSILDARLIKGMNMNAVRSHYPPDEHFLDVCDSLGLLYLDELAGWQNNYDDAVGPKLLAEMVRRDVNHPCIYLWSNGNEGGWNEHLDAHFADYDPQKRHVVHPWADFNQLDTHHYPTYLTGVGRFNNGSNVFMPTEFMHAMYDQGGGAGLADFWNRWLTSPLFAGGFIWAYCDEAPARSDRGGVLDSDNSNAPDGLLGPHREREGSYYSVREVWSPIQIRPIHITPSYQGELMVSNAYLFSSLKQCRLLYRLQVCPSPLQAVGGRLQPTCIEQGSMALPDVLPGETKQIHLPLHQLQQADVLELVAIGVQGDTVCNWSFPVHSAQTYLQQQLTLRGASSATGRSVGSDSPCEATRAAHEVTLHNGSAVVTFSAEDGRILSIVKAGREVPFTNGPVAVGMKMKYRADLSTVRVEQDGGLQNAKFVARYQGGVDSIVWTLSADGLLSMDAVMLNRAGGGGGFDDAFMDTEVKNLGLTFSYPEQDCSGVTWLGRGPYRVWKNRIPGTNYNIWHKDYNNTITGESFESLVYPEFKGYHANLYWATVESPTVPFTVYSASDNLFFRLFTPEEPHGRADGKATMPAFPEGDISFLLDIPAIQSFKPTSQQGPQSQPGNIRIKKGDAGIRIKLLFDFLSPTLAE